ncbi:hypothetical protein CRUP_024731 [Coryphaenoides rupestris]|nr:hypothetical protein CRUP_024731 [Coryphaenoides rupestris]
MFLGWTLSVTSSPSDRCSLSSSGHGDGESCGHGDGSPAAMEMGSPAALGVGSPAAMEVGTLAADSEDPLPQEEALCGPAGLLNAVSSAVTPQSKQGAESDMLLFTPDLQDRVRASMCPSDLMVFTPQ